MFGAHGFLSPQFRRHQAGQEGKHIDGSSSTPSSPFNSKKKNIEDKEKEKEFRPKIPTIKEKGEDGLSVESLEKYLAIAEIANRDEEFSHLTDSAMLRRIPEFDDSATQSPLLTDSASSHSSDDESDDLSTNVDEWVQRAEEQARLRNYPLLNILILIVGSRGDVQPFISFAQASLKKVIILSIY